MFCICEQDIVELKYQCVNNGTIFSNKTSNERKGYHDVLLIENQDTYLIKQNVNRGVRYCGVKLLKPVRLPSAPLHRDKIGFVQCCISYIDLQTGFGIGVSY